MEHRSYYAKTPVSQGVGPKAMAKARQPKQAAGRKWQHLVDAARAAYRNAHAPYSNFRVGAALRTTAGEIFAGCNVENTSYGLSNCAERTAIFAAVAQTGPTMEISEIAIACEQDVPCPPCGACRQVIYEFGPRAQMYFRSAEGWKETPITELLPDGFRLKE